MPSDDSDDDEVAIEDSQEPATSDTGEPLQVAAGGPVTATVHVRKGMRPISETVRKVFAASMEKVKARGEAGDGDDGLMEPVEHEDLPIEGATPVPGEVAPVALETAQAAQAAAVATATAQQAAAAQALPVAMPAPVAAVAPPAPSPDPEVLRLREDYTKRMTELDAREAQLTEAQRANDISKLRDTYFDKGAPALAEIIKQWMPGLSEDELKNELADVIQDLAHQYLEAPLDQSVKDRIATKRTRAGLKSWRADQDRVIEEQQKKLLATQEEQNRVHTRYALQQEVTKPQFAPLYPYLVSEANAGDIIHEVIVQEYQKTGQHLIWMDAAQRAEDWLKSQALAFYDKRKHLLSPQPPLQQQQPPADKQRTQGDNQVSRSHAPPKSPVKPTPQEQLVGKWTPERHRETVKAKFRAQFKNQFADED